MTYLAHTTKPTIPVGLATREYERALRALKVCARNAGKQSSDAHIQAAKEAAEAVAIALADLRQSERAEGIKLALNKLTAMIEREGGSRARSIPSARVDEVMRELFTATR